MNPADQRIADLVARWLQSIELHLKYAALTDEAYWQVQPWGRHQRPARWILDLAHARALELKRQIDARIEGGEVGFGEALELMAFLANLVGAQNIERFIPLADPLRENAAVLGQTESASSTLATTSTQTRAGLEPTREMRSLLTGPEVSTGPVVIPPRRGSASRPAAATAAPSTSPAATPTPPTPPNGSSRTARPAAPPASPSSAKRDQRPATGRASLSLRPSTVEAQIISDAVRLLKWGRQWHELATAISRIADRPGVVEVRKCLRTFKSEIEKAAAP